MWERTVPDLIVLSGFLWFITILWTYPISTLSIRLIFSESGLKVGGGDYRQRSVGGNDRNLGILVTRISTYLAAECQNRSENLTNRKLTIFYIEVMNQLFFQLRWKKYFFHDQKYFSKKNRSTNIFVEISRKSKFWKFWFFLSDKFFDFWKIPRKYFLTDFFSKNIFDHEKIFFPSELKKKLVHNFYVENC